MNLLGIRRIPVICIRGNNRGLPACLRKRELLQGPNKPLSLPKSSNQLLHPLLNPKETITNVPKSLRTKSVLTHRPHSKSNPSLSLTFNLRLQAQLLPLISKMKNRNTVKL